MIWYPSSSRRFADNPRLPALGAALALAYAESGNVEKAHRLLEQPASVGFDLPLRGAWLTEMVLYAEVAAECGDTEAAGVMLEWLAPCAGQFSGGGRGAEGPVDHYLGRLASLLGRYDVAETYFARSALTNQRMDATFFAARTDLHRGQMLADRDGPGDTAMARELLTRAHAVAAAHGYGSVKRRASTAAQGLV